MFLLSSGHCEIVSDNISEILRSYAVDGVPRESRRFQLRRAHSLGASVSMVWGTEREGGCQVLA